MVIYRDNNLPIGKWVNTKNNESLGDIVIEVPHVDFNEEKNVEIYEVEKKQHKDEGVKIGHFEILGIRCKCIELKSLYFGLPPRKGYRFKIDYYLYDENDYKCDVFLCDNLKFIIFQIIENINEFIDKGFRIADLNWEWINWQCTCWNGGDWGLRFYENDILSPEDLYDRIEDIIVTGMERGINYVGKDNDFWNEITVELKLDFPFVDRYIGELLFSDPQYDEDSKIIKWTFEDNYHSAYKAVGPYRLSESVLQEYKSKLIRSLRIYKVHLFNNKDMRKRRFLKN